MKTIVYAYHDIGCEALKTLSDLDQDIVAVFTHKPDPKENVWFASAENFCHDMGLPVFTPENCNSEKWIRKVKYMAPDIIFSFYYRNLICEDILHTASYGAFNLHGSLLPKYRGRAPVNWAIVKGEKETGLTLHHMVLKADAGDIVAQKKVAISREDTALTLFKKLVPLTGEILKETVPLIEAGKAPRVPQNHAMATKFPGRTPEDGRIDWTKSSEEIYNLVRAVTRPYPGAFADMDGRKLTIWKADTTAGVGKPGEILSQTPLTVACGVGALILKEIE
ncbi:MAG: hypothetical protein A2901_02570 [Elusimicrobia bacterium RIFCSPLOWO2_01_FULL_54_10]|nr:MAG: hypothetical protein A2901_02570 [Elusimicrobia bacterium RIFCSPLOWO2_01_FULL_54_10]